VVRPAAREVRDAEGVLEARVARARVDVVGEAQLLELAQALELGGVDDGDARGRQVKVPCVLGGWREGWWLATAGLKRAPAAAACCPHCMTHRAPGS